MLTSRQPMFVWWGDQLINLYNDAYRQIVGGKHPQALGRPAAEVWREIWDQVGPRARTALETNSGTYDESLLLIMERNGYPEETYYTFSYSPVPNDLGGTGGILCANTEDTQRIISQRQILLLRELATRTADARSFDEACIRSARGLDCNPFDVPFAMIYLVDPDHRCVRLAGTTGLTTWGDIAPATVALDSESIWPFAEVAHRHKTCVLVDLNALHRQWPTGAWQRPPHLAAVVPIAPTGQTGRAGILVAGLNPYRLFDDDYRGFVQLVANQIAGSIANAQAYEEERKRAEALAELDRAKTTFFSNVSHEFRTPLALMLGPVEDVLNQPADRLPGELRQTLAVVQRNGQRLLKLVNTLLDFSRIEAGRVDASYEPTDLAACTAELASVFRSAIEKAGLQLTIDCLPLSEAVHVDRDMWEKIVLNLISNAFKFTLQGEIAVTLHPVEGEVELSVRDTGNGIPTEEIPKLFERFYRVEGTRGRSQEGSGIGLALVRELVLLHGGKVRAESEEGKGSVFFVRLPFGTAHLPESRIHAQRSLTPTALGAAPFVQEALRWLPDDGQAADEETDSFELGIPIFNAHTNGAGTESRPRVLLADDNSDMRDYVRRLLSERFDVRAVSDGLQAVAAARECSPDLVLSDVMMPGLDGFGVLQALRNDPRTTNVPVVLLSAKAGEEARVEGLEAGADDYLTKPFSAKELLARVEARIEMARLRQQASENERSLRADAEAGREFLERILEGINDAFLTLDRECCIVYANPRAAETAGLTIQEMMGRSIWNVFPAAAGTEVETAFRHVLETGVPRHLDHFYQPLNRWFEIRLYPAPRGLTAFATDVTDRRQMEDRLKDADRRKDEFLATLAHELRNPLAPISSAVQVLRHRPGDAGRQVAHDIIERQVRQMARLVDDLLDISRITRGKLVLRRERLELTSVICNAIETSRPLIDAGEHTLQVALPDKPVLVNADALRLGQIISNLLNNAAKYTDPGGLIQLSVACRADEAVISVRDSGVGISPQHLPQIFEMFSQITPAVDRSQGGLGIGLSLVRGLVELHGGQITASSRGPGQGSEFTVQLPIPRTDAAPPASPTNATRPESPGNLRILVVDDNHDAADMLAMMLRLSGHMLYTAYDGREAVDKAGAVRPDLALIDIGLPELNGYEAARQIRSQEWGRAIRLVALTGWGQDEDKRKAREAGFDDHLTKPVACDRLNAILASFNR